LKQRLDKKGRKSAAGSARKARKGEKLPVSETATRENRPDLVREGEKGRGRNTATRGILDLLGRARDALGTGGELAPLYPNSSSQGDNLKKTGCPEKDIGRRCGEKISFGSGAKKGGGKEKQRNVPAAEKNFSMRSGRVSEG